MGQGLVLATLIVLGAQMLSTVQAHRRSSTKTGALLLVTVGRLILAPLIAYAVGGLIGLDGLARKVLTLQAATPSAVMSLVLATEFDTDVPFCGAGGSDDDVGQHRDGDGPALLADVGWDAGCVTRAAPRP